MNDGLTVRSLLGREILDSRGNPTVEVECELQDGTCVRAAVPSGASTGSREAVELRDNDAGRFRGKGVLQAVANVNEVILRSEKRSLDSAAMTAYYAKLIDNYPLVLLEDGMAEDDWAGWKVHFAELGGRIELVGDDVFCTNPAIIARGIEENIANAVLIKLNQIGTLTETIAATRLARNHGWGAFVSHRSGETVDSFIADMTVALDTGHLKTGAPARGERVEKYNQLLRIEQQLGPAARYAGTGAYVHPPRGV